MQPLLTAQQMKDCDACAVKRGGVSSQTLMERAARAAVDVMLGAKEMEVDYRTKLVVLCGSGNNGGDGFAMARLLWEDGYDVVACYAGAWEDGEPSLTRMSAECARQYLLWRDAGGKTAQELVRLDRDHVVIVDALFGVGLDRAVTGHCADWIETVNRAKENGACIFAVDVPSGVAADTGEILGCAVRADVTATMAYPKRGLLLYPGTECVGRLAVCPIGVDDSALNERDEPRAYLIDTDDLAIIKQRPAYANKGTFGRVLVVGGCLGMSGAVYFAAKSAYRMGAGLVELLSVVHNRVVLQTLLPEAVFTPLHEERLPTDEEMASILARADSVVLGCGLGQSDWSLALVEQVLRLCSRPMVIDADGLNLIANHPRLRELVVARTAATVLTPHVGEAARLSGQAAQDVAARLFETAATLARRFSSVCVLKDARTVVSDGRTAYIQSHGNSGMATGGTGDCLAGVIASLMAQHRHRAELTPAHLAALGVLVHARAGDLAAACVGASALMADDIANALGKALMDE